MHMFSQRAPTTKNPPSIINDDAKTMKTMVFVFRMVCDRKGLTTQKHRSHAIMVVVNAEAQANPNKPISLLPWKMAAIIPYRGALMACKY